VQANEAELPYEPEAAVDAEGAQDDDDVLARRHASAMSFRDETLPPWLPRMPPTKKER